MARCYVHKLLISLWSISRADSLSGFIYTDKFVKFNKCKIGGSNDRDGRQKLLPLSGKKVELSGDSPLNRPICQCVRCIRNYSLALVTFHERNFLQREKLRRVEIRRIPDGG